MNRLYPYLIVVPTMASLVVSACSTSSDSSGNQNATSTPNILLVIADDQGVDASAQYDVTGDPPRTPVLNALAAEGLVFDNAWATPGCTTTRGTVLTGMHGIHSGISFVPATLDVQTQTLHGYLAENDATARYASAVVGKWHMGGRNPSASHPGDVGIDYFAGNVEGVIDDYEDWTLTINGDSTPSTDYHTSRVVDLGIDWISGQEGPWFLYLAFVAPHSPFHLPDPTLHQRTLSGTAEDIANNSRDYYLAAIEAMDHELGRLLDSMSDREREQTVVIYLGDNGTPRAVRDTSAYPATHNKGTLYEGGVRVPLIVSGAGVDRAGEREAALVHTVDIFATIAALAGRPGRIVHDSISFSPLLAQAGTALRQYNYTEFESADVTGWAVRDGRYKLIEFEDGSEELYDLHAGIDEATNLLPGSPTISAIAEELAAAAVESRLPLDAQPGEATTDITDAIFDRLDANCASYVSRSTSSVMDVFAGRMYIGDLVLSVESGECVFETNDIPNHDFNDGVFDFANAVAEQEDRYAVSAAPTFATATTALTLTSDNAILLNGVKVDLLAAGCFGVGDGRIGCNNINQPWRYDPMFPGNGFRVDSHNAHTQPNGAYHYHGPPNALFELGSVNGSPVVGFAADGFPVFGSEFYDPDLDIVRVATSSYRLKAGVRPSGAGDPGGAYDGTFRDDYEYVDGAGDLDECNGMELDGVYGYYITASYPYIIGCFKGVPHASFEK